MQGTFEMWKIAISYAQGTVKDSARKFVTFQPALGIWRNEPGVSSRYQEITSSSFSYNKIFEAGHKVLKALRRWRM